MLNSFFSQPASLQKLIELANKSKDALVAFLNKQDEKTLYDLQSQLKKETTHVNKTFEASTVNLISPLIEKSQIKLHRLRSMFIDYAEEMSQSPDVTINASDLEFPPPLWEDFLALANQFLPSYQAYQIKKNELIGLHEMINNEIGQRLTAKGLAEHTEVYTRFINQKK